MAGFANPSYGGAPRLGLVLQAPFGKKRPKGLLMPAEIGDNVAGRGGHPTTRHQGEPSESNAQGAHPTRRVQAQRPRSTTKEGGKPR